MKLKIHLFTLLAGTLFLLSYFLSDFLWEKIWIFYLIPLVFLGFSFLGCFVMAILNKNRTGIFIGAIIIGTVLCSELINSEIFKSKKTLEATLIDDQSAINLTLRADKKFEMVSSNMFSEKVYKGNYQLIDDKIIFKNKRYDNDFIPDTVSIIGDKIIIRFDKNGKPITDFARYFDIKRNEIQKESK
jgi:hypothetical protein